MPASIYVEKELFTITRNRKQHHKNKGLGFMANAEKIVVIEARF